MGSLVRVLTNDAGKATFVVPPIEATLSARSDFYSLLFGFVTMTSRRKATISPETQKRFIKTISPKTSDKRLDVEFLLEPTKPIELVCVDLDGKPVAGVHCLAALNSIRFREEGITNDQGKFTFRSPYADADIHRRDAEEKGAETWIYVYTSDGSKSGTRLLPRVRDTKLDKISITLKDSPTITGRAIDSKTKKGIEGVVVDCFTYGPSLIFPPAITDRDGNFKQLVPPDSSGRLHLVKEFFDVEQERRYEQFEALHCGDTKKLDAFKLTDLTQLRAEVTTPDISKLEAGDARALLKTSFDKELARLDGWLPGGSRTSTNPQEIFLVRLGQAFGKAYVELAKREPNSEFERTVLLEGLLLQPVHELMGARPQALEELRDVLVDNHLNHARVRENFLAVRGPYDKERYTKMLDNTDDVEIRRRVAGRIANEMVFELASQFSDDQADEDFQADMVEVERILDITLTEFREKNEGYGNILKNALENNAKRENAARKKAVEQLYNKYYGPPYNLERK